MGDNRATVKSNIQTINVPSVTNAELNTMLQNYLADNLKFYADEAFIQSASTTNITLDFTGKDRIDLTRTGGALNITLSGLSDGDLKYILITKSANQSISFIGATDITPVQELTDLLTTVLYTVTRKGSNYYAWALAETVVQANQSRKGVSQEANDAEVQAGTDGEKHITPLGLSSRTATTSRTGLAELATNAETKTGTNTDKITTPQGVADATGHRGLIITTTGTKIMDRNEGSATVKSGTASGVTIQLPAVDTYTTGRFILVSNESSNTQTVNYLASTILIASGTSYIFANDGTNWFVVDLKSGFLCPFIYINGEFINEILRNHKGVENYKEDVIDITESLKEGRNIIKLTEEKDEKTFIDYLILNVDGDNMVLFDHRKELIKGDEHEFEVYIPEFEKAELKAKGYYILT